MNRRTFIQQSALALGGAALAAPVIAQTANRVGIQLFSIPQMVANDFTGTLKLLRQTGYREIEFFGPYAFSAPQTIDGWKPLAAQLGISQNAFYGYTPADVKKMLADEGLSTPSVHLDLITLRENLPAAADGLAALGTKYVAIPALNNPAERQTLDQYKKLAAEFNAIGEKLAPYGLVLTYHNHGYEHAPKDGVVPLDLLLQQTDARYVTFEMDIFWLTAGGGSPTDYLKKYPGRFRLMHVKDATEPIRFTGDGGTPDQWIALFPKMADPGSGVFDLPAIIATARQQGVNHFYLERDLAPDPSTTIKKSYTYLSRL